jgi:hypothetical protein
VFSLLKIAVLRGLLLLLGLVIGVVAITAFRLVDGPVSLGYIKPMVQQGLNQNLGQYSADMEDIVLVWSGWDDGVEIRALQFRFIDAQANVLATLPQLAIGFETSELMAGRIAPESLKVYGPELSLLRREDGSMGFGSVAGSAINYEAVLAQVITILLNKPDTGGLDRLTSVGVAHAELTIKDIAGDQDWQLSDVNFTVTKSQNGLDVALDGGLHTGQKLTDVKAGIAYDRTTDNTHITLNFVRLVPSSFARDFGFWQNMNGLDIPITATLSMEAGPGFQIDQVAFDLRLEEGRLTLPKLFSEPVGVSQGRLVGVLDRSAGTLTLDSYKLLFGAASLEGHGKVYLADDGEGYEVALNIADMPFSTLTRLWPITFKPFSRGWMDGNITAGVIRNLSGLFKLAPGFVPGDPLPEGTFSAAFELDGLTVHYLRPMPALIEGIGHGTFSEKTLDILIKTARVVDGQTGMDIDVKDGRAILDDLNVKEMHYGSVKAHVSGRVSDLVYITTFEPLKFAQAYSIEPSELGGRGEASLDIRFPLLKKLLFSDVDLNVDGRVEGFSATILDGKTEITEGSMALKVDSHHLEAEGDILLEGLPFAAKWTEQFVRGDGFGSHVSLNGRSTTRALTEALEFPIPFPGTIGISLDMLGSGLNLTEGTGTFDFADATMSVPQLTWDKPISTPALLSFVFDIEEETVNFHTFTVANETLSASGSAKFGFSFTPKTIDLDALITGENNLSASLSFDETGTGISGIISGKVLDFRPFIDSIFDEGGTGDGFALELDLDIDQGMAHGDVGIDDFVGLVRINDGILQDIHLTGLMDGDTAFVVSSVPLQAQTEIRLNTDNAGRLIRALGVFDGADAGVMSLTATTNTIIEDGATTGRVKISDFKVVNAPGLARILNLGSITGIRDIMGGGGISFDRFDLGFSIDQGELRFKDAVALGPSVGLRMGGRLYDDMSQLEIEGTIIPAYTINTIIRSVPILGDILTGGSQDGPIGIDFSMSGPVSEPIVKIDSSSILAPGLIKNIFGGRSSSTPETNSN